VRLNITAKIFKADNSVIEKQFGDADGETRTFVFFGEYSDSEIEKLVENQVQRLRYTGFQSGSSFKAFGKSTISPLDVISFDGIGDVTIFDKSIPNSSEVKVYEKSSYLVESVVTTYDSSGFKQNVTISNRVNIDTDSDSIVSKLESKVMNIEDKQ
jgi:hypothetical protein